MIGGSLQRHRRTPETLERIRQLVMVVATSAHERRLGAVPAGQLESEDAAIECESAFEIGDPQVYVADYNIGMNRLRIACVNTHRSISSLLFPVNLE
jgi:hypothetical protein